MGLHNYQLRLVTTKDINSDEPIILGVNFGVHWAYGPKEVRPGDVPDNKEWFDGQLALRSMVSGEILTRKDIYMSKEQLSKLYTGWVP